MPRPVYFTLGFLLSMLVGLAQEREALVLDETGVFFVGGEVVEAQFPSRVPSASSSPQAATQIANQALIHYLIPASRENRPPIVMVPGLGLTSYMFLTTPDGREGWAQIFARAGHPVYVLDMPDYGISGFEVSSFNAVQAGIIEPGEQPGFSIWTNEEIWRRWGFGERAGEPYENGRYPVESIQQLQASFAPRLIEPTAAAGRGRGRGGAGRGARSGRAGVENRSTPSDLRALVELLEKVGPAVVIVHSAGGNLGFEAARMRPKLVSAIVALEPVGCPREEDDSYFDGSAQPFLAVYGDYLEIRRQTGRLEACRETARITDERGSPANVIVLPEEGTFGNSHLFTQDSNSLAIANRVIQWLDDLVEPTEGNGRSLEVEDTQERQTVSSGDHQ